MTTPHCWVCHYGTYLCNCPAHPEEHLDDHPTPQGTQRAVPLPQHNERTGKLYPWPHEKNPSTP